MTTGCSSDPSGKPRRGSPSSTKTIIMLFIPITTTIAIIMFTVYSYYYFVLLVLVLLLACSTAICYTKNSQTKNLRVKLPKSLR